MLKITSTANPIISDREIMNINKPLTGFLISLFSIFEESSVIVFLVSSLVSCTTINGFSLTVNLSELILESSIFGISYYLFESFYVSFRGSYSSDLLDLSVNVFSSVDCGVLIS